MTADIEWRRDTAPYREVPYIQNQLINVICMACCIFNTDNFIILYGSLSSYSSLIFILLVFMLHYKLDSSVLKKKKNLAFGSIWEGYKDQMIKYLFFWKLTNFSWLLFQIFKVRTMCCDFSFLSNHPGETK